MKYIIGAIVLVGGGMLILEHVVNEPLEVVNRSVATSTIEVVPEWAEEVDVIDSAQSELERINNQLDTEEMRLVEERDRVVAEKDKRLQEIDARLDKISETRASFH